MKDTIIKQTGNSRRLKTSLPAGTTWEEALDLLREGNFPIDLLGLVTEGVQQQGTAFSKATMLDDATVSALGLSGDVTPNQAILSLANKIKNVGKTYGTCTTAAGTAAKVATLSGFTLTTGSLVAIKFSNINTHTSPTLNVNGTGAKPIYDYRTSAYPVIGAVSNSTHLFVYNGSQWVLLNPNTSISTLEACDWNTIKAASDAGIGASLWAVGDTKTVALSGTVGAASLSGSYKAFILGFNHNSAKEGSNRIHFQFGKNGSNVDVAFCDSKYNSTGSDAAFRMNTTNTNSGGWNGSYMKNTICPAFRNALPATLRNVLKTVTKFTDNTGGGSDTASYVTSTSETIFLLAEFEVFGARSNANSAEKNSQQQYDYYKNGNSRIKYQHGAASSTCGWWLRSPRASDTTYFCIVYTNGNADSYRAYYSYGFAPGFCV